jgi:hypothetical protein
MSDFEFALEKEIRQWRITFDSIDTKSPNSKDKVVPTLIIKMTPFPDEGIFQKIHAIVRSIDPDIQVIRAD